LEDKFYSGIEDLPIYNWIKVNETSDFSYLAKVKKDFKEAKAEEINKLWHQIYDEYLAKFGLGALTEKILKKQVQIARLRIRMVQSGDDSLETMIEINELELAKMIKPIQKGMDFYKLKALIEKRNGFVIDAKKCTVVEFYSYLDLD